MSGFLCMDKLNLTGEVELYHGRLAMVGIVGREVYMVPRVCVYSLHHQITCIV